MGTQKRDVVLIVVAAVLLTSGGLLFLGGGGAGDLVFGVLLLVPFFLALRHAVVAGARAHGERSSARRLSAADPARIAAEAARAERIRLSQDIQSAVRSDVQQMKSMASEAVEKWGVDPRPALRAVQDHGRQATSELRRLLGLLREEPPPPTEQESSVDVAAARPLNRPDLALAAFALVDAVFWSLIFFRPPELEPLTPVGVVLTCAVAVTVVARTVAPGAGAVLAAFLVVAGTLTGHRVGGGLWIIVTLGCLAWACGARERSWLWAVFGPLALTVAFIHRHHFYEPENLLVTLMILGVGLVSGLTARVGLWQSDRARATVVERQTELGAATDEALHAERRAVARELHDVVSGSVGVVVMQAGAAEALMASNRDRARHALSVVVETCDQTLVELGQLTSELDHAGLGGAHSHSYSVDDIHAVVERIRSAGLDIDLQTQIPSHAQELLPLEAGYRVVQEALLNALRHAPDARVSVLISEEHEHLVVDVANDGQAPTAPGRRGYGLVGLAERVHHAGGSFAAGPAANGGFRVHAEIPVGAPVERQIGEVRPRPSGGRGRTDGMLRA